MSLVFKLIFALVLLLKALAVPLPYQSKLHTDEQAIRTAFSNGEHDEQVESEALAGLSLPENVCENSKGCLDRIMDCGLACWKRCDSGRKCELACCRECFSKFKRCIVAFCSSKFAPSRSDQQSLGFDDELLL